jgi:hypothetical protein
MAYDLQACRNLVWAILARAVRDIKRGNRYEVQTAVRFIYSEGCAQWCEPLDMDITLLRQALQPGGPLYAGISPHGERAPL